MAIRGSLREASLPDVLQLLSLGQKTGCLTIEHRESNGAIYFERGRITYASIANRPDRLGARLLKDGHITPAQLESALAARGHSTKRLGELLVDHGAITLDQLRQSLRVQIEEAIYLLFTWADGTFNFEADVLPTGQDVLLSIRAEAVLLEGARRLDEWEVIEKKIPSVDLTFEVDPAKAAQADAALTPDQRAVLELVDGLRTVQGIMNECGFGELEVAKHLYGLVSAGLIQPVGPRARRSGMTQSEALSAMANGIARFLRGELAAADAAFQAARPSLDAEAPGAEWYHYAALTAALRGDLARARETLEEGVTAHPRAAALGNNLAVVLERAGQLEGARVALDRALDVTSNLPQLHKNLGDLHFLAGRFDDAFDAYSRAQALNPRLGDDVYVKLGTIHHHKRRLHEARNAWEQALSLNPANDDARRQLQSLSER